MIDSHCHLDFDHFSADREAVMERAQEAGVTAIINPAVDLRSCEAVLALNRRWPQVHVAVGVHPNSCQDFNDQTLKRLSEPAQQPGVVAIGEIGLDFYRERCPRQDQMVALRQQLKLAAELALPVIIHNRDASDELLPELARHSRSLPASMGEHVGVLHSFSASAEVARQALDLGFYIGFTGPLTFRKAEGLRAVARDVPPERLLVETDAPFLSPVPHRGKRNEPAYLPYIVDVLAGLHGMTSAAMAQVTSENTRRLFRLPN